jgi:hypothetical protein
MPAPPKRETELYAPLKSWLEENGYTVRSEVLGCDIAAEKDGALVLIEMKLKFGTELLLQATQRQRAVDTVYVALPRPDSMWGKKWRSQTHLLKRLELGLIVVNPGGAPEAEVVFHPAPFQRQRRKAQRQALLQEMNGRSGDYNTGGSHGTKLMTAYREKALFIACCLDWLGPLSPKALRACGAAKNAGAICYTNHYGWFERIAKGSYAISAAGRDALEAYSEAAAQAREKLSAAKLPGE